MFAPLFPALHWPVLHRLELFFASLLLIYAAMHDVAVRTIPDMVPAVLAALGLVSRGVESTLRPSLLAAALLAASCSYCWWRGWLGGGDVKLLAALALLLPPHRVLAAIVAIGWCGVAVALPYVALRRRLTPPAAHRPAGLLARVWRAERFRLRRGGPLPYGVAIAVGGLLELFWQ